MRIIFVDAVEIMDSFDILFSKLHLYRQLIGGNWSLIQGKMRPDGKRLKTWMRTWRINKSRIEDGSEKIIGTESY